MVFQTSMFNWRRVLGGSSAMGICALCYICNLPGVMVLLGGGVGVNLPWLYMHYAIYETDLV